MNDFQVHILATNKVYYEGPCQSLVVPTPTGMLGIQANRANMVSIIKPGVATITIDEKTKNKVYLGSGLVKVEKGDVNILVELAEKPEDMDKINAQAEIDREKELKRQQESLKEYKLIQARLAMTANKLKENAKEQL